MSRFNSDLPVANGKVLLVIGGGAAGFFCAINAASRNRKLQVILIEKTSKLLSKVRVSGGGRCNVTHACFDINEMSRNYPRGQNFVRKAFHQFSATDTISWFEERGVKLKAEKDGRMFPESDSSESVVHCLMQQANMLGIQIRMNAEITHISTEQVGAEKRFIATLSGSNSIVANFVCVAAGGYPKSSMFNWLRQLGHSAVDPIPSLFTFNLPKHNITKLMGVSVERARVKIAGSKLKEEGPLLITHWGLSGPVVLRLSAWGARELALCNYQFSIHINWLPAFQEQQLKEQFSAFRSHQPHKKLLNLNVFSLPARLWEFLLIESGISEESRISDLPIKAENLLIKHLTDYTANVSGKTTFKEEFVTAGGIALNEVDVNTMMSRKIPMLFFAGEILDVDGITGGFNFQNAWTSGWISGKTIAALSA
ncbi:MAG TPA: NAD(P)/FAD-dependent oxidoreductase [Chitinophagaceae bacterium]|nr:NAD(P)/FAD-dependent oxidoreductase [Chitinophagaceae bacterium]